MANPVDIDRGDDAPDAVETRPRPRLRAASGLLLLAGLGIGGWQLAYWEPRVLPVRVIEVQGQVHHHSSELLQRTLAERLKGGFLTADLWDLKRAAEDLAWVGTASIRRVWPDRLEVKVAEHRPVGHWNGDALVTGEGVIFRPESGPAPVGLPLLEGPDARAAEVAARYLQWRDELMLAGHLIQTLSVDARGAWRLDLVSGPRLELGTERVEERLARFIRSTAQLQAAGEPLVVDLRYANGFAVRWRPPAATAQTAATAVPVKAAKAKPRSAKSAPSSKAKAKASGKSGKSAATGKAPVKAAASAKRG